MEEMIEDLVDLYLELHGSELVEEVMLYTQWEHERRN